MLKGRYAPHLPRKKAEKAGCFGMKDAILLIFWVELSTKKPRNQHP